MEMNILPLVDTDLLSVEMFFFKLVKSRGRILGVNMPLMECNISNRPTSGSRNHKSLSPNELPGWKMPSCIEVHECALLSKFSIDEAY